MSSTLFPTSLFGWRESKDVKSSFVNLSRQDSSTLYAGVLTPVYSRTVYPGDRLSIKTKFALETMPLAHPLYSGMTIRYDWFYTSWEAFYGWAHDNINSDASSFLSFPRFSFVVPLLSGYHPQSYIYPYSAGAGSLFDWMGCPTFPCLGPASATGAATTTTGMPIGAEGFLAYWNIFRHYYANLHEQTFPMLTQHLLAASSPSATPSQPNFVSYSPRIFDQILSVCRQLTNPLLDVGQGVHPQRLNLTSTQFLGAFANLLSRDDYTPIASFLNNIKGITSGGGSVMAGFQSPGAYLLPASMKPDLYTRMLSADPSAVASVSVQDDGFSIDTLRFRNKLQRFIDAFDITGGRVSNWVRSIWRVKPRRDNITPYYLGSVTSRINFQDVVNTSAGTSSESVPLGVKGSIGKSAAESRTIHLEADFFGTLSCIVSIIPDYKYSQFYYPEDLVTDFAGTYQPTFARLGFQQMPLHSLAPFAVDSAGTSNDPSVLGRTVAFSALMTDVDRAHGYFALGQNMQDYVFNRPTIGTAKTIAELQDGKNASSASNVSEWFANLNQNGLNPQTSAYCSVLDTNKYFADTSIFAQNFRLYSNFTITGRRRIPEYTSPSLL